MIENERKQSKWNLDGVIKYLYKKNELGGDENEKQYQIDNATLDLLEELQKYQAIGTVEECREAMERQRAKKPIKYDKHYYKCVCGAELSVTDDDLYIYGCEPPKYCEKCGQVLSWECDTD